MTVERGKGWEMHLGDCLEVMPTLTTKCALVTDPPYGIDLGKPGAGRGRGKGHGLAFHAYASFDDSYESFVETVVPALDVAISSSLRAAVFTGPHIHEQRKPDAIGGVYCPAGHGRHCWGFKTFLPVLLYGAAPNLNKGARPTVLVSSETVNRADNDHPVPKPDGWMLWLVALASASGETILDPFAGSGTTGVACLRLGRKFIGIEKDPTYFALACERLRAEEQGSTLQASRAGQLPLLGTG